MSDQGTLDFGEPSDAEQRFRRFHENNPGVYLAFVRLALEAHAVGRQKIGMKMLFEVVRWEWIIAGLPDEAEEFKLNNNYAPRYARLLMADFAELEGIFETRKMQP